MSCQIVVDLVDMYSNSGRYIGKTTRVTFPDGGSITFLERLSKSEAIRQAARLPASCRSYR